MESVNRFFDLLEEQISKGFDGTTIHNVDETAISTVQKRCQKILGQKGKHQIGAISSGERGTNTTVVCCVNNNNNNNLQGTMCLLSFSSKERDNAVNLPMGHLLEAL